MLIYMCNEIYGGVNMAKRNYNSLFNQLLEKILEYQGRIYFVTLTMKDDKVITKDSISNFLHKLAYRNVTIDGYVWVKELQKRGVVHYHMIILTPEKIRDFYSRVNESWGYGFVFVKGIEKQKVRNTILYIMKYIRKDLNANIENEKMKRKIGRGGILRFRTETFLGRVVKFSEFEYVASGSTKGMKLKMYRFANMVMFVSSGINGVSIDVVDWDIEKISEKFKYGLKNTQGLAKILNDLRYLALDKVERSDVLGYHKFSKEVNQLLWQLGFNRA